MNYGDVFTVRTQTIEQLAFLLDFFDPFTHINAVPCWQTNECGCGATMKGGWCPEVLKSFGGAA